MRRSTRLPLEALAPYLLEAPPPRGPFPPALATEPLDWRAIFGNDHPVEIEVGFGKGLFLVSESQARPGVNFVGIEIERKYVLHAATRLAKRALKNVRVAASDARWFLPTKVRAASVQAVHVYFPDPWWKTRHRKRKLLTEEFVTTCGQVLAPGGTLHLATDVEEYFVESQAMLARLPDWRLVDRPVEKTPTHEMDYLTHFERKYRKEGRSIYRAIYRQG